MTAHAEQPFAGVRVVEFGQFVAVPFCAQLLAEGGADVIKIEALEGDPVRVLGQLAPGETRTFLSRNRGKRSLPLNLRHPDAGPVLDALLTRADVALMNFRPGLAEGLGLDTATLRARYPRLIVGAVTPFGRDGPDATLAGMDIVVQARSGLMVANGRSTPDGDDPTRTRPIPGDPVSADYMCAMTLAYGIAAALLRRERTGEGAAVDTSLMQAALTLNNNQMLRVESVDGPIHADARREIAARRAAGAPYDECRDALPNVRASAMLQVYFRTYTTADGWIAIACGSPRLRARFIDAIGLHDAALDDPAYPNADTHYQQLRLDAEATFRTRPTAEWERILAVAGVPASDVKFPVELLDDPQASANHFFDDLDHPAIGPVRLLAPPLSLDDDGFRPGPPAAPFASDTRPILVELGFDAAAIDELVRAHVTRDTPFG